MTDSETRVYRDMVMTRAYRGCAEKITDIEELEARAITDNEISDILEAEVGRISLVIQKLGHNPISHEERNQLFHLLAQRAVEVGQPSIVLEGSEPSKPWLRDAEVNWSCWRNYEEFLLADGKSRAVIDEHRIVIDRALDLAGDPMRGPRKVRKG